jgi:hypothetical protein
MNAHRLIPIATVAALISLEGCGIAWTSGDLPSTDHGVKVVVDTPNASATNIQTGKPEPVIPEDELRCEPISQKLLTYIEGVGNAGGAVRYTKGQMVAYGNGWWAVVVRRSVEPGSGFDPLPEFAYFDTTAPNVKAGKARSVQVRGATPQHHLAEKCLS